MRGGSDVDIALDVKDGFSLFDLCGISKDMADLLGTKVDVVTEEGMKLRITESAERGLDLWMRLIAWTC